MEWARTGLDLAAEGPRIPALTVRLRTMQARALAAAEQHVRAARALEAVQRDLEGGADGEHPWLSPFDAAALASESALILRHLERLDEALLHAEQAVALRETGRARSLALSQISLVDIQVRRRQLDAAVHAAHALLSTSRPWGLSGSSSNSTSCADCWSTTRRIGRCVSTWCASTMRAGPECFSWPT